MLLTLVNPGLFIWRHDRWLQILEAFCNLHGRKYETSAFWNTSGEAELKSATTQAHVQQHSPTLVCSSFTSDSISMPDTYGTPPMTSLRITVFVFSSIRLISFMPCAMSIPQSSFGSAFKLSVSSNFHQHGINQYQPWTVPLGSHRYISFLCGKCMSP